MLLLIQIAACLFAVAMVYFGYILLVANQDHNDDEFPGSNSEFI